MKNILQVFGFLLLSSAILLGCVTQHPTSVSNYSSAKYRVEDDSKWQMLKSQKKDSPYEVDGYPNDIIGAAMEALLSSEEPPLYFYRIKNPDVNFYQKQEDATRYVLDLKELGFYETIDPTEADFILEASYSKNVSEIRSGNPSITDRELTFKYWLIETNRSIVIAEDTIIIRYYMLVADYEIVEDIIVQREWQ